MNLRKHFLKGFILKFKDIKRVLKKISKTICLKTSSSLDIPIIAGQEVYYLEQNMAEAHDALVCIGNKQFLDDKNRFKYSNEHFLKK